MKKIHVQRENIQVNVLLLQKTKTYPSSNVRFFPVSSVRRATFQPHRKPLVFWITVADHFFYYPEIRKGQLSGRTLYCRPSALELLWLAIAFSR